MEDRLPLVWRDVRVVEGTGLENRRGASLRGFESHSLRHFLYCLRKYPRGRRGSPAKGVGWIKPARGFKSLLPRQRKPWNCNGSRVFSLFFPQLFPQLVRFAQNLLDILLRFVCGLLPRFLTDMGVNIRRCSDGRVAQGFF